MVKICFRVDASTEIGLGHLVESISLAGSLKKSTESEIVFLVKNYFPVATVLEGKGYQVEILGGDASEEDEISEIYQAVERFGGEVLICDLLNRDNEYFAKLRSKVKTLVVILDDAEQRAVPADIVVNFNIAQDEEFYKKLSGAETIYCIGPMYMLLAEELHDDWRKEKVIPQTCQTIFVNQGGSDPFGLTVKIVEALELLDLKQRIVVVMGQAVSEEHKKELESLKPLLKNRYQFEGGIAQERMQQLMSESDVAVTAAGNTLYELAIFGVPSITVCHHERHNVVAQKFAERNAAINLGIGADLDIQVIADVVNQLLASKEKRVELSVNMKKIVDGLGSKRVAEEIIKMGT